MEKGDSFFALLTAFCLLAGRAMTKPPESEEGSDNQATDSAKKEPGKSDGGQNVGRGAKAR